MKTGKVKPKIVSMVLADLAPAGYNPRTISDEALAGLVEHKELL